MRMRTGASAAFAVSIVATTVLGGGPAFPTWRGDTSLSGVVNDRIPDLPTKVWEFQAGSPVTFAPVAGDGTVFFVAGSSQVFALDMNGVKLWSTGVAQPVTHPPVPPQSLTISAPPAYAFGTLVVATSQGSVHALEGRNGRERWSVSVGERVQGTPSFVDMGKDGFLVLILTQPKGTISAFDGVTGVRKWFYNPGAQDKAGAEQPEALHSPGPGRPPVDPPGDAPGAPFRDSAEPDARGRVQRHRVDGHISVSGNRIAYGGCDASIHVLSATNGESLLSVYLGKESEVAGGVAFAGRMIYTGCRRGLLCAVDTEEKCVKWNFSAGTAQLFTTPAATDKIVVFSTENGSVIAVDPLNPTKPMWRTDTGGMRAGSPIIVGERVVVAIDGRIHVLDLADGQKVLWTSPPVGDLATAPAVAGGMVIVGSDSGSVAAFGAAPSGRTGESK